MAMATSSSPSTDELKKQLISIVNSDKILLKRQDSAENLAIVEDTVNRLITAMKQVDELFNDMYQRKVYTGSYWDGLRLGSATEFDLNMVLRLPFKEDDVQIIMPPAAPAFLQYHLKRSVMNILSLNNTKWPFQQKLVGFFDKENNLVRGEVQSWIQGVITKALSSPHFQKPAAVKRIATSQSGPAFTLFITIAGGVQIDVDLVPVIDGCYPTPKKIHKSPRFNQLKQVYKDFWFMVPKPYSSKSAKNPDTFWRISFPEAEKNLLPTDGCLKNLIKLFKLLRDAQNWDKLASYFIKTLFLLELDVTPKTNWPQDQIGIIFLKMLGKLKAALETKQLSYYFNRNANLFSASGRQGYI
uniref:Uncharacterized protein n=1 Tax=Strigamia maritima TaxID=126957 RepID=T1ISJ6_STRMM